MEAVEEQPEPVDEEKEDEGAMDDEAWAKKFMTGNLEEEAPTREVQVVKADTSSRPAGADEDQDVRLSLRVLPNAQTDSYLFHTHVCSPRRPSSRPVDSFSVIWPSRAPTRTCASS